MFSSDSVSGDIGFEYFQTQNTSQATQQQHNSGLARFRSAPSSLLATLLDSDANNSSSGDESEAMFSAFMNGNRNLNPMVYPLKQEIGVGDNNRFSNGQMGYEGPMTMGGDSVVGSYSVGMESSAHQVHVMGRNGNSSNLLRQSSSPAGFLNGFSVMGDVSNYKLQNHSETSLPANGLSNRMNLSSSGSSSSRFMPSIPEVASEGHAPETYLERKCSNVNNGREFKASVFPHDSWRESSLNSLKRNREGDLKMFSTFNGLENQIGEARKSLPSGSVHHLSMPKTSSEMAAIEKYLQFQPDTVPCQVRAKRGYATHPRSIAERIRRTKISEKMKKLQDLFPNIDKQTSTSDMLDSAVEYIKDLQKQVQTLSETRAKCVCLTKPQQSSLATQSVDDDDGLLSLVHAQDEKVVPY